MVKKSQVSRAPRPASKTRSTSRDQAGAGVSVWRQVVEELPTPIALVDGNGVFVAANRAFRTRVPAAVAGNAGGGVQDRDLASAGRLALVAVDAMGFSALSPNGPVFDCCRLDSARDFVALVGQAF